MTRSHRRSFLTTLGVLALITTGLGLWSVAAHHRSNGVIQAGAVDDTATPGFRFVAAVPPELADDFFGDVQAWSGTELLAFGSDLTSGHERSGGVAYNPESGAWRQLSRPAFEAPVAHSAGVWTGDRLVVLGVLCSRNSSEPEDEGLRCTPGTLAAAVYRPDDDRWESISAPPSDKAEYGDNSSGGSQRAIGAVGRSAFFTVGEQLWMLSAEGDEWSAAPGLPEHTNLVCPVEGALIAVTSDPERMGVWSAATFHPGADVWAAGPEVSLGDGPFSNGKVVCARSGALLASIDLQRGFLFDQGANDWQEVAAAPKDLIERPPPPDAKFTGIPPIATYVWASWTGRSFVFWQEDVPADGENEPWPGIAVAFDAALNQWKPAAPGPPGDTQLQWADGYAFVLGAQGEQRGVAIYVPGP